MHPRDAGKHRQLLETDLQYSGRPGESGTGQPARSESTQRPQDRSERRLVAGAPTAARHGDAQLYPATTQRELRDLTRRRRKLIQTASAEKNRISKVLEDANIQLGNVLSDVFGVSGQLMLEALLQGKTPDAA